MDGCVSVTCVVPCYNERRNIVGTIEAIETAARQAAIPGYEVLLVDDGSEGGTGALVAVLAHHRRSIALISITRNLGLGGACKKGTSQQSFNGLTLKRIALPIGPKR